MSNFFLVAKVMKNKYLCNYRKDTAADESGRASGPEFAFERGDLFVPQLDAFFFFVFRREVGDFEQHFAGKLDDVKAKFKIGFWVVVIVPMESNEYAASETRLGGRLRRLRPKEGVFFSVAEHFVGKPLSQPVCGTDVVPHRIGRSVFQTVFYRNFFFCHFESFRESINKNSTGYNETPVFCKKFCFRGKHSSIVALYEGRKEKRTGCLPTACLCVNLKFNTMKKHTANVNAVFVFTKQLCEKEMVY